MDEIIPDREDASGEAPRKKGLPWLQIIAWTFGSGALLAIVAVAGIAVYLIQLSQTLPSSEAMQNYQPEVTTRIHAGDGSLVAEFARERRLFVPVDSIPDRVKNAFIAAEDKNYYTHFGMDPAGIVRAAIKNIDNYRNNRRLEGASTITQQVARNFLLTSEVSYVRKIKEILIAVRMDQTFTKDHVLELYLNEIYLGWRSYGIAAAALNYFDKSLEELTIGEVAYLASLPKGPNNYDPVKKYDAAVNRRNWVIERMAVNGFITAQEAEAAKKEKLVTYRRPTGAQTAEAEYFAEEVRRQLYDMYDDKVLYGGGLSVRTTLDPAFQKLALNSLRFGLEQYDRRHGWRGAYTTMDTGGDWAETLDDLDTPGDLAPWSTVVVLDIGKGPAEIGFADGSRATLPLEGMSWARPWLRGEGVGAAPKAVGDVVSVGDVIFVEAVTVDGEGAETAPRYELRQIPAANGGIVAIDPHTGRVLAMVGGFSYEDSEFNRAVQAFRQPGSSFKPFVYAAALDNGYTPASIVLDGPLVVEQGPGLPLWKPKNYSSKFYGLTPLRTGIEQSRNLMTARLALDIGMAPIVDYANRFGIKADLEPRPAMALGAGESTLYRMVSAYAVLVNGGKKVEPTLIDRIQDRYGKTIYRHDRRACTACEVEEVDIIEEPALADARPQIVDPRTAYQVVSMLEGAVLRGTGRRLRSLERPLAGKTGTTNESRDAWFMGLTPDLVVGAYVGFDTPRSLGSRETGGRVALPIVQSFFEGAIGSIPGTPFRIPAGLKLVRINPKTGLLARPGDETVILEAFKPGTEPTSSGNRPQKGLVMGADGEVVSMAESEEQAESLSKGTGGLY